MAIKAGGGKAYVCVAWAIKTFRKAPTSFQTKYPQDPQESEGRRSPLDNEWLALSYSCIAV